MCVLGGSLKIAFTVCHEAGKTEGNTRENVETGLRFSEKYKRNENPAEITKSEDVKALGSSVNNSR